MVAMAIFMLAPGLIWAQTSTQNFGTGTGSHTNTTGSATFIPNPTSGTTWARAGGSGSINLVTASNPLGTTGAYVRGVASTSTAVTKFSPWVAYTSPGTEFYTSFKVLFGDASAGSTATSGTWCFYQGAGTIYSDASDFAGAQVFTGLRFIYGTGGALALTYRGGLAWINAGLSPSSFSSATVYTVEIIGNNKTSGTISYTYNGAAQTVAVQKFDLYINGTKIGDDLAEAALPANTNIVSGTFIGISSSSNVANIFVDDAVTYNAVPAAIGSGGATPPSLSAATGATVDAPFDVTFTNDGTWAGVITGITVGGTPLTAGYAVGTNKITFTPSASLPASLLQSPGTKSIVVSATGYNTATVSQTIGAGAPTTNSTSSINLALAPNTTRTITCTAKDQYNNLIQGYTFKYDATVTDLTATTDESYTIDGTARTSTANDINLVATTNGSGVATFTAALPATIDGADGISIQVQLSNGTTNIGSAYSFLQLQSQTITFGALTPVTYGDAPFAVSATGGGSGNPVTFTSTDNAVATCTGTNGATLTIIAPGTCTINANQAGNSSYNAAPQVGQSLLVNTKALTLPDAAAQNKVYTGTNPAVITGTLTGKVGSDVVTLNGTGTFATVDVANGIAVTSTCTLGGAAAAKYTLTQPINLFANITPASQTITFAALPSKIIGDPDFSPGATSATSGVNPITYASSNTAVATIISGQIHIAGIGTSTITASQAASLNYNAATDKTQILTVTAGPVAAWDFSTQTGGTDNFGTNPLIVTTKDANVTIGSLTRGSGLVILSPNTGAASAWGSNNFTVSGTLDGEITANKYFYFTITTNTGFKVSLSGIAAYNIRKSSSGPTTGQWQYQLGSGSFVNIGSAITWGTVTTASGNPQPAIDLSGISDLQNVFANTTITFRLVCYGATSSGGTNYLKDLGNSTANDLIINGTVASSNTTFTGTGNWSTAGNWSNGIPTASLNAFIDGTATIDVVAETNDLTINAGKSVTISDTKSLKVNGTFVNSAGTAGLVVKSGGSLIESNGVPATAERAISGSAWHLISAPVSGVTAEMFTDKYMQTHLEGLNSYTDVTDINTALTPCKGFALWGDAAGFTAQYVGPLNTGAQSYSTTYEYSGIDPANNGGWNLVGNPYPSAIDFALLTRNNVNNAFYVHISNSSWGVYAGSVVSPNVSVTQYIASGQGFFVQASAAGSLSMTNSARVQNNISFYKNSDIVNNLIRLTVSGNGYTDEAVVRFVPEATAAFDGEYDAHKLYGDVAEAAQLYTGSTPLAINALPETNMVPVGVHVGTSGVYTIAATEINDLQYVTLEDTKTGVFTELAKSAYSFNFVPGENEQRFILHFSALGVNELGNSFANIYSNSRIVYVDLKDNVKGDIFIYNISGQLVATVPAAQGKSKISLVNTGNYIVKVITDQSTMVKKVFVQ